VITGVKEVKHAIEVGEAGAIGVTKMHQYVGNISK
jgi:hypothetical protein